MDLPDDVHERVLRWYDEHARDLPWRAPDATPWGIFVSELMLQQTPVVRVLPVWAAWMDEWPTPVDLAAAPTGDAVRAWGRLGYPRRALRLHAAATAIVERHGGQVPDDLAALRALPGVGDYTAAAVASFAFRQRHVVLDTNVRRVQGRAFAGRELPGPSVTKAERELAAALLPDDDGTAAAWAVGVMELGALVCSAVKPACPRCPLEDVCAWHTGGRPAYDGPVRRVQTYAGTDRQCRGRLLAVLRDDPEPVHVSRLDAAWADDAQRTRCLAGLLDDGLVTTGPGDTYRLPD
jgi:A/G-specific adenine glycosylase